MTRGGRLGLTIVVLFVLSLGVAGCAQSLTGEWWSADDGTVTKIDKEWITSPDGAQARYTRSGSTVLSVKSGGDTSDIRYELRDGALTLTDASGTAKTYLLVGSPAYKTAKAARDKGIADAEAAAEAAREAATPDFLTWRDKVNSIVITAETTIRKNSKAGARKSTSQTTRRKGYRSNAKACRKAWNALLALNTPSSLPDDVAESCRKAVNEYMDFLSEYESFSDSMSSDNVYIILSVDSGAISAAYEHQTLGDGFMKEASSLMGTP